VHLVNCHRNSTANRFEEFPFYVVHDQNNVIVYDRAVNQRCISIPISGGMRSSFKNYINNLQAYGV